MAFLRALAGAAAAGLILLVAPPARHPRPLDDLPPTRSALPDPAGDCETLARFRDRTDPRSAPAHCAPGDTAALDRQAIPPKRASNAWR